jgi:hypothetical protein
MTQFAQILGLVGSVGSALLTSLVILEVRALRFLQGSTARLAAGLSLWSILVFLIALVGIVGAALVRWKPRAGGVLMLFSGVAGIIAVVVAMIIVGQIRGLELIQGLFSLLLVLSGILGLVSFSGNKTPKTSDAKP